MKLFVQTRGGDDAVEVHAMPWTMNEPEGRLSVTTPFGDDWLQSTSCDLRALGAEVVGADGGWIVRFPDDAARQEFLQWLREANKRAEHGYNTMRG